VLSFAGRWVPKRHATALRDAGLRTSEGVREQRRRNGILVRYFTAAAVRDFKLNEQQPRTGVIMLLGGIDNLLAQWRIQPTAAHAVLLENTFVALGLGGLDRLSRPESGSHNPAFDQSCRGPLAT